MVTAFGGHHTDKESGLLETLIPWSLHLDSKHQNGWFPHERGAKGTSGALSTTVPEQWLRTLCKTR